MSKHSTHHPANVRIKRAYFTYLQEAKRQNHLSVDAAAAAIARYEAWSQYRDFKGFHHQQAIAFKKWLVEQKAQATGEKLCKATLHTTLSHLKRFFFWLAGQPGYRSRFDYSDADYFNISAKDARIASAQRSRPVPTLNQLHHVIALMPTATAIDLRNRATIALTLLTGARDSAIASAKLKHIDLDARSFFQDARDVKTKNSKTFITFFFPVGENIEKIVADWVNRSRCEMLRGDDDPLFPKTLSTINKSSGKFEHVELSREHWANATPIRKIFRDAFEAAGLPYFNPHSLRNTLTKLGEKQCSTAEEFKSWSQNLGHEKVLTTYFAYGTVASERQRELIRELAVVEQDEICEGDLKALNRLIKTLGNRARGSIK